MDKEFIIMKILLLSYFYKIKNLNIDNLDKKSKSKLKKILQQLEQQMQQDTRYGSSVKRLLDVLEKAYETYTNQSEHLFIHHSNAILLSFENYIKRELNLVDSEIYIAHTWGLENVKQGNHNHYAMITAFLKTNSNIVTDAHLIIKVRKIITNVVRSYWKQQLYHLKNNSDKQHHFQYLNVIEIAPNNHLHMHFYLYNPEFIQLIQTISNRINNELKQQNLQVNIHVQIRHIYYNDKNYSNVKHNIYNKMKGNPRQNQIVLFALRKLFSKKRLVTHSKIPITKEMLKKEMKKRVKKQEKISYLELAKELLGKILINNKKWKKVQSIVAIYYLYYSQQIKNHCFIIKEFKKISKKIKKTSSIKIILSKRLQMSNAQKEILERELWNIANLLRGKMNADEYKNYILGFIFYKYLSEKQEIYVNEELELKKEVGVEYIDFDEKVEGYEKILEKIEKASLGRYDEEGNFIQGELGFFLKPNELFNYIVRKGNRGKLILNDLKNALNAIENRTFGKESEEDFIGLFEDVDLTSPKLGKTEQDKNNLIMDIFNHLAKIDFDIRNPKSDILGDAYKYLIGKFAADSGKKGENFIHHHKLVKFLLK